MITTPNFQGGWEGLSTGRQGPVIKTQRSWSERRKVRGMALGRVSRLSGRVRRPGFSPGLQETFKGACEAGEGLGKMEGVLLRIPSG